MTSRSLSSQTARGAEYQPGMLFTVFVIILLAALGGFAPAVANDLACADVYIYITRGGCRERKGKINTRLHKPRVSRYRYPCAVSPLLSHAFSPSDILYPSVSRIRPALSSHTVAGRPLRAGPQDRPGVIACTFWDPGPLVCYVEVQQGGSPRVPPTCSSRQPNNRPAGCRAAGGGGTSLALCGRPRGCMCCCGPPACMPATPGSCARPSHLSAPVGCWY